MVQTPLPLIGKRHGRKAVTSHNVPFCHIFNGAGSSGRPVFLRSLVRSVPILATSEVTARRCSASTTVCTSKKHYEDNTHLAQRVCGVALFSIQAFAPAAQCFFRAYDLDNNDLWSLKQAGFSFINEGEINKAIAVHDRLKTVAEDSSHYIELHNVLLKIVKQD